MGGILRSSSLGCVVALAALPAALGQNVPSASSSTAPQTVVDVLHQLSDQADVIFAGQVVAIRRPDDTGWVEVEFRVDQTIRGCTAGTPYILREWAGLWAGDAQRYRVGQRLLMLLHAPSAAGMSSPVSGLDGAIPIRQGGTATPFGDVATPPQRPFVDLRWLGTRLSHAVSYRNVAASAGKVDDLPTPFVEQSRTAVMAEAGSAMSSAATVPMIESGGLIENGRGDGSVPAQQASVDAVMGMLIAWQKARHVSP